MALILCPNCGKQISSAASACVHCGYAIAAPAKAPAYTSVVRQGVPPRRAPTAEERAQAEEKAKKDTEILKKRAARDGALYKKCALGESIGRIGMFGFWVFWVVMLIITSLFELSESVLIALLCIFLCLIFSSVLTMGISDLLSIRLCIKCANWIRQERLDVRTYLKSNLPKNWKERGVISYSLFLGERSADRICSYVATVVPLSCYVLAVVLIALSIMSDYICIGGGDTMEILMASGFLILVLGMLIYGIMCRIIAKQYGNWAYRLNEKFRREAKEAAETKQP